MLVLLSMLNIGLSAMMAALGVLTLISVHKNGVDGLSEPFLAAYMVMFAILLFVYELMWWRAMPGLNKSLRKNFGFLYGLRGKGFYLIFVAFLCLGLGKEASVSTLNWATGIAYMAAGCFHIFLVCANPLASAEYIAASPTAGLMSNDNAV
jgi:COPI associated protein